MFLVISPCNIVSGKYVTLSLRSQKNKEQSFQQEGLFCHDIQFDPHIESVQIKFYSPPPAPFSGYVWGRATCGR